MPKASVEVARDEDGEFVGGGERMPRVSAWACWDRSTLPVTRRAQGMRARSSPLSRSCTTDHPDPLGQEAMVVVWPVPLFWSHWDQDRLKSA